MLVRLLVAVLMLTGPNPARVCTCAASASPPASAAESLPTAVAPHKEKSGCGCRGKSDPASATTEIDGVVCAGVQDSHSDSDRHPHDQNCPAVNPQPVVSAVPPPAPDAPADYDLGLLTWAVPSNGRPVGVANPADSSHRFRSVPLYISLLTLRN